MRLFCFENSFLGFDQSLKIKNQIGELKIAREGRCKYNYQAVIIKISIQLKNRVVIIKQKPRLFKKY